MRAGDHMADDMSSHVGSVTVRHLRPIDQARDTQYHDPYVAMATQHDISHFG